MSTKSSIRSERDNETRTGFHLYEDIFEEGCVYLKLEGIPFEATYMPVSDEVPANPSVTLRFPMEWAKKLGLLKNDAEPTVCDTPTVRQSKE